jgi:hypothetical protein
MPVISLCPRCQRQVSLPSGVDSAALVRCPLCNAEYPLSESLPPELVPIAVPSAEDEQTITLPLEPDADLVVEGETKESAEIPLAQSAQEEEENEATAVVRQMPIGATRVRRRTPKPWWQTFIEVVTGGLAGCLLAYYGLAFWLGPQFNLPKYTFLPFIAAWTAPPEKVDGTDVKSPVEKPPKATADVPKAEPKSLRPKSDSADYVGPRMPPSFTSDQLGKALAEANDAVSAAKAGKPIPPMVYEALCRLGEAVAFVEGDASDAQLTGRITAAGALLGKICQPSERFDELGRLAGVRIDANSRQNAGILVSGVVKNVAQQGRLWGAAVQLAGPSKTVSVLSDRKLEANVDDRVLVLGVVVREPGANLVGYSGTKPAVVWAAALMKKP